jgi:hypothetical protein
VFQTRLQDIHRHSGRGAIQDNIAPIDDKPDIVEDPCPNTFAQSDQETKVHSNIVSALWADARDNIYPRVLGRGPHQRSPHIPVGADNQELDHLNTSPTGVALVGTAGRRFRDPYLLRAPADYSGAYSILTAALKTGQVY